MDFADAVESVLMEHPAVNEAVVTKSCVDGLTRIGAWIVPVRGRASSVELSHDLQEWCKSRLERYQYPHVIDFVDQLPRTETGKVDRRKLRA